jgi:hypothetical protein
VKLPKDMFFIPSMFFFLHFYFVYRATTAMDGDDYELGQVVFYGLELLFEKLFFKLFKMFLKICYVLKNRVENEELGKL